MIRRVAAVGVLAALAFGACPALSSERTAPEVEWVRTREVDISEGLSSPTATPDGGCVLTIGPDLVRFSAAGEETWRKPRTRGNEPTWAAPAPGGGFLIVSRRTGEVEKYDSDGNLVTRTDYEGHFGPLSNSLVVDGGRLLLCGSSGDDALLMEVDQDLAPIWQETYDAGAEESALAIAPGPDGGYIVACNSGRFDKPGKGPSELWVIKCDPKGRKLAEYKTPGIIRATGRHYLTRSGGFYYVCFARTGIGTDARVVKLDGNLKEIWRKSYGVMSLTVATSNIAATADGGVLIAGTKPPPQQADADQGAWVVLVDAQGAVLGETVAPLDPALMAFRPVDFAITEDGCILVGSAMRARKEQTRAARATSKSLLPVKLKVPQGMAEGNG